VGLKNRNISVKTGTLLGLAATGAVFFFLRKRRLRSAALSRPAEDAGEGLRLNDGVDIEAAERAVRAVGVATWT
jgi:hypothetical protein